MLWRENAYYLIKPSLSFKGPYTMEHDNIMIEVALEGISHAGSAGVSIRAGRQKQAFAQTRNFEPDLDLGSRESY